MCVGLLTAKTLSTGCLTDMTPFVNKTCLHIYAPPTATVMGSQFYILTHLDIRNICLQNFKNPW